MESFLKNLCRNKSTWKNIALCGVLSTAFLLLMYFLSAAGFVAGGAAAAMTAAVFF